MDNGLSSLTLVEVYLSDWIAHILIIIPSDVVRLLASVTVVRFYVHVAVSVSPVVDDIDTPGWSFILMAVAVMLVSGM